MASITDMRSFLASSLSSFNSNKLHGLLAEVAFREHIASMNLSSRVSPGGWIFRNIRRQYATKHVAAFPMTVEPEVQYRAQEYQPAPMSVHPIASILREIGIVPFWCSPETVVGAPADIRWNAQELGLHTQTQFKPFPECIEGFEPRQTPYNFLRYAQDTSRIPDAAVAAEFSKESLRVAIQEQLFVEISDIDGILSGPSGKTYPLEIKEKTAGADVNRGEYFGIDIGPFVKLAFFAARRQNMNSLFVVREIDNVTDRQLIAWWSITFDRLAEVGGWTARSGGQSMSGGGSSTIMVPKSAFSLFDATAVASL